MNKDRPCFKTLPELLDWCRAAPPGTQLDARAVGDLLGIVVKTPDPPPELGSPAAKGGDRGWTWREKLWVVPAETRLGVVELSEALGRPKSWVYARTYRHQGKGTDRRERKPEELIPHRKLGAALAFTAGEIRTWIRLQEEEVSGVPMDFVREGGRPW